MTIAALLMLLFGYFGDVFFLRLLLILILASVRFRFRPKKIEEPEEQTKTKDGLSTTELGTHQGMTSRTLIDEDAQTLPLQKATDQKKNS
jgi:hypothetical protein